MKICIAFFLLLTSFSVAKAECAWILWTKDSGRDNSDKAWEIRGSYTIQSACASQQKVLWDEKIKEYGYCGKKMNCEVSTELNVIYIEMNPIHTKSGLMDEEYFRKEDEAEKYDKPHNILFHKFLCLPDTVDPRERKQ